VRTGRRKEERKRMEIKIEKGIPMKKATPRVSDLLKTIGAMEVGDSFAAPESARKRLHYWRSKTGVKLASRSIDADTIRVWRVA
jgi:hypothetical protein